MHLMHTDFNDMTIDKFEETKTNRNDLKIMKYMYFIIGISHHSDGTDQSGTMEDKYYI